MNDERAFGDEPADFLLDKIEPQHPLAQRALDVRGGDPLRRFAAREVRRLAREIVDRLEHREHSRSVARHPHAEFHDLRQRAGLERRQILRARQRAHARRIMRGGCAVGRHRGPHLSLHLEQVRKVRIVKIQHVVEVRAAEHHDLVVNLDRLGLQSAHREKRERLERLQRHAARLEAALERFPDARLDDRILEIEDQEAAVRFQKRSADDAREVGARPPQRIDPALDRAEQVAIGRRVLEHHRRAARGRVVDHHVDLVVEPSRAVRRAPAAADPARRRLLAEAIEVAEHVLRDLVEVRVDRGIIKVML